MSKLIIHNDGELDVFSKQILSNCYFERGGLLPLPPPDGLPVLLGPFTGVLLTILFSRFVNDTGIMIEGLATFGYIWRHLGTKYNYYE